jgi:ribosomal protein S18 acetylase RimI-like enzyme
VRQPRALGLQAEDIDCLVKLPGRDELVQVRPKAPSGNPHQAPRPPIFGLPAASGDLHAGANDADGQDLDALTGGTRRTKATPAAATQLRYQQVYQLTPSTLAPYAALTFPSHIPGSNAHARHQGELLAVSAMANGEMVGFAIAERQSGDAAALRSLCVDPAWRRQGIGTGLLARLQRFIDQDGIGSLTLHYQASELSQLALEPILRRLGWSQPNTDFLLLEGQADQLAAVPWAIDHPIAEPYQLTPWSDLNDQQLQQVHQLGAPGTLLPPADPRRIEPAVSLALLHSNDLVGWVLAERLSTNSLRYSSFFVAEHQRGRARGPALLANAFNRQQQAKIPFARAAIAADNQSMLRLLKRHLKDHLISIGRSRTATWSRTQGLP